MKLALTITLFLMSILSMGADKLQTGSYIGKDFYIRNCQLSISKGSDLNSYRQKEISYKFKARMGDDIYEFKTTQDSLLINLPYDEISVGSRGHNIYLSKGVVLEVDLFSNGHPKEYRVIKTRVFMGFSNESTLINCKRLSFK